MRRAKLFREDTAGAAMVELAFALPILLVLVWGVIDFGRLLFTANSLAGAVREGARYAAVLPVPAARSDSIRAAVRRTFVPLGGPAITDAQIVVTDASTTSGSVTVAVEAYPFPTITPISSLLGKTVSLTRQATFRWERATAP